MVSSAGSCTSGVPLDAAGGEASSSTSEPVCSAVCSAVWPPADRRLTGCCGLVKDRTDPVSTASSKVSCRTALCGQHRVRSAGGCTTLPPARHQTDCLGRSWRVGAGQDSEGGGEA